MAVNDLEIILDGASDQFLDIDATGVITIEYPATIKGYGLTEADIKALTNQRRNWMYVDTDLHQWLCTRTIGDADPTAWVQVKIDVDLSVLGDLDNLTTTDKSTLVGAINEVDSHADANATAIENSSDSITAEYDNTATYVLGEYCIHDHKLYQSNVAITTAEAWNSAHWDAVNVMDQIGNLQTLRTTAKTSLVSALNEIDTNVSQVPISSTIYTSLLQIINSVRYTKYFPVSIIKYGNESMSDLPVLFTSTTSAFTVLLIGNYYRMNVLLMEYTDPKVIWMRSCENGAWVGGWHSSDGDRIEVVLDGITSLPKTFSVPGITADHKLIQEGDAYVSPRSSMADGWTLTAGNGTITVSGTFSGSTSTTIIATMGIPNKTVTGVAQ